MSGKTSESQNSYKDELDLWKLDIYTAASLGDVSFFVKYDFGQELILSGFFFNYILKKSSKNWQF